MPTAIPLELIEAYQNKKLNLFVGAGVSSSSGMIGWDDLISEIKDIIRRENNTFNKTELENFLNSADHLDIVDVLKDTIGDHQYYKYLRSHFRSQQPISRLLRSIANFDLNTIFTTNYDKLLETTIRDGNGQDPPSIIFPNQLGYIDDCERRIIKLHGDIDHPSTIVLSRSDYANYSRRHRDFEIELHKRINDYTMLFVGFGLRDKNFRRVYEDARQFYDSVKRKAFALMVGTNAVERDVWDTAGLKIIPFAKYSQIPTFINKLASS